MIIGLTGYLCSGKDTIAEYIVNKGFKHISLSDILRDELKSIGKEVTRENLQELGKNLRERFGPGALAERAYLMTDDKHDYVISSIGTVGEVDILKKHPGFTLIFVDAPQKVRWNRMKKRSREQDPVSFKNFKEHETLESKGGGSHYRAFDDVKKSADIVFVNDGTLKQGYNKTDKMLHDLRNKRPSWDEYFISIVDAVGQRGTCNRGKSGAVFVRDNRLLATGYVGSPIGLQHCDDIGHLFSEVMTSDGKISKHCIRTIHAEQNAIAQAAKHGISIDGSTCYCTMEPCFVCCKMLVNAGVKRVVAKKRYHGAQLTRKTLKEAGISLDVIEDELMQYPDQGNHKDASK
jgi:dCMP deaminase